MSPIREQLVGVIDCLPETEQSLLLEIARPGAGNCLYCPAMV